MADSEGLTPQQIETLKGMLTDKLGELTQATQSRRDELKEEAPRSADLGDRSNAVFNRFMLNRTQGRDDALRGKIVRALRLIEEGDYGYCDDCTDPIGFRRMMARPMTTLCVECKGARETAEKGRPKHHHGVSHRPAGMITPKPSQKDRNLSNRSTGVDISVLAAASTKPSEMQDSSFKAG